jgi:transposase-like protein
MAEPTLDPIHAVIFIDAINVKICEGQVANRPIYLAPGVTVDGERDVLGMWAGEHGDGEGCGCGFSRRSRTAAWETCACACDGLKGLPDAVSAAPSQNSAAVDKRHHFIPHLQASQVRARSAHGPQTLIR